MVDKYFKLGRKGTGPQCPANEGSKMFGYPACGKLGADIAGGLTTVPLAFLVENQGWTGQQYSDEQLLLRPWDLMRTCQALGNWRVLWLGAL